MWVTEAVSVTKAMIPIGAPQCGQISGKLAQCLDREAREF
jgi:hypothetical protein